MYKPQSPRSDRHRSRFKAAAPWGGAALLHLVVLGPLLLAPVSKSGGVASAFGQSVSITLISTPGRHAPAPPQAAPLLSLASMADRLSRPQSSTSTADQSAAATSLSELTGGGGAAGAPASTGASAEVGGADDPLSRSFVSYRGSDPAKATMLRDKMRACVGRTLFSRRVRIILDSNGRLIGPAILIGGAERPGAGRLLASVERCAPYTAAAVAGMPRSYEIELP
jgi:hypothetical protein